MTKDQIRELAHQAGFSWGYIKEEGLVHGMTEFAKLVAQHEREACAKVCEDSVEYAGDTLAEAIRVRGQE